MLDVTGAYNFYRTKAAEQLWIPGMDAAGTLLDATLNGLKITGTYNSANNTISFNDASEPGEVFFTSFCDGYAIPDGNGSTFALAGTHHYLRVRFGQHPPVEDSKGSWYAVWQGVLIS